MGFKALRKRLVICCDGTWQAANHASHEIPSNIAKLSRAISKTYIDENNHAVPQIVFDDAGVATSNWLDAKMFRAHPTILRIDWLQNLHQLVLFSPAILDVILISVLWLVWIWP